MKKILALICAIVLCTSLFVTGCSDSEQKLNDTVVATIGGVTVSQADYNLMYKSNYDNMAQYSQYYGDAWYNTALDASGTTIGSYLKTTTMDALVEMITVAKLAEENGITVESIKSEVEEARRGVIENQGGSSAYETFLEDYRTTDKAVRTYLEREILYSKLVEKLSAEGGVAHVSEDDVVAEFTDKYLRVQHILIMNESRSDEEALKLANEVISKLKNGADFDALISEYNEDPGMTSGNYYTFTDGTMVAEFEEASKNLEVGKYTLEPVKTDYGYHIIKKYETTTECSEFETFRTDIVGEKVMELINQKKDTLKIEKKDDVINKYLDKWLKDLGVDTKAVPVPEATN